MKLSTLLKESTKKHGERYNNATPAQIPTNSDTICAHHRLLLISPTASELAGEGEGNAVDVSKANVVLLG
jgi:hypothetical protein